MAGSRVPPMVAALNRRRHAHDRHHPATRCIPRRPWRGIRAPGRTRRARRQRLGVGRRYLVRLPDDFSPTRCSVGSSPTTSASGRRSARSSTGNRGTGRSTSARSAPSPAAPGSTSRCRPAARSAPAALPPHRVSLATVGRRLVRVPDGLTGATLHDSFGWNTTLLVCIAAVALHGRDLHRGACADGDRP